MTHPETVNLEEKFGRFTEAWSPRIVGELNGQQVKLARFRGEFLWHAHEHEDELFLVVRGTMRMGFRDGDVLVREGEFLIVPRGVEHCPAAEGDETWVMLLEPASTVNTGTAGGERTVTDLERL
ncbi:cupin domain-containing protein [Deinococcus sp. MIMF12]|uniref:Cupin domain-containing protein n=1 Tax=Deinococcus rhizophilus TaxID=3049544 RepID=A0ABT7JEP0_9DEIO|nr:cupin domain-containing protein [Deinococcus rhizophilus]MDL2342948.1 cupin domain-containing protein [Deinococcus rhizophilus]